MQAEKPPGAALVHAYSAGPGLKEIAR